MKKTRLLGIWMDHSHAHAMTFVNDSIITETIESGYGHLEKEDTLAKSENILHNKEQQKQGTYYKKIADIVKKYEKVLLFGPTNAKNELANLLKEDHHFDAIEIELKSADKMSTPQLHAFVKHYFQPPAEQ